MFMMAASVVQLPVADTLKLGGSLGYQPGVIWLELIWPRLYPMIRLPVYNVLAFAISVVDVALVIGPANPPTIAYAMAFFLSYWTIRSGRFARRLNS